MRKLNEKVQNKDENFVDNKHFDGHHSFYNSTDFHEIMREIIQRNSPLCFFFYFLFSDFKVTFLYSSVA